MVAQPPPREPDHSGTNGPHVGQLGHYPSKWMRFEARDLEMEVSTVGGLYGEMFTKQNPAKKKILPKMIQQIWF